MIFKILIVAAVVLGALYGLYKVITTGHTFDMLVAIFVLLSLFGIGAFGYGVLRYNDG